jgi:hypothetical protein
LELVLELEELLCPPGAPGVVALAAGGVVVFELLPGCERFGVVPLFGLVLLLGVEPFGGAFGVVLGFKLPGVTPPPGVVGVPGASGGVTPGGDELDGAVLEGDLLVDGAPDEGDGDWADEEDGAPEDAAPPAGAPPPDWAWAPVAATRPSAAAAKIVLNLSMRVPLWSKSPRNSQARCPVWLEVAASSDCQVAFRPF